MDVHYRTKLITDRCFFESDGENPRIMLITESPAGPKKIDFDITRINEWKQDVIDKRKS